MCPIIKDTAIVVNDHTFGSECIQVIRPIHGIRENVHVQLSSMCFFHRRYKPQVPFIRHMPPHVCMYISPPGMQCHTQSVGLVLQFSVQCLKADRNSLVTGGPSARSLKHVQRLSVKTVLICEQLRSHARLPTKAAHKPTTTFGLGADLKTRASKSSPNTPSLMAECVDGVRNSAGDDAAEVEAHGSGPGHQSDD